MKKFVYLAAAAMSVVAMSACSGNKSCDGNKACDGKMKKGDMVYTGVLPAADTDGVRYTLKLDYDDDNNKKGDYDLVETYLATDTTATNGYRDDKSFTSEGDFTVIAKEGKDYLQLVQDVKDSMQGSATTLNFLVENDSTLVLVNSDFQKSETPGLNYTLKLVK